MSQFISIISPISSEDRHRPQLLQHLPHQSDTHEIIFGYKDEAPQLQALREQGLTLAPSESSKLSHLLKLGLAKAKGDIYLFLHPDSEIKIADLEAIRHNFTLMPDSVGGTFHLKIKSGGYLGRSLTSFLHRQRYKGRYFCYNGLFIRRDIYEAIGGFGDEHYWLTYNLGRQMEAQGPSLYLPEAVLLSPKALPGSLFKTVLVWFNMRYLTWLRPVADL